MAYHRSKITDCSKYDVLLCEKDKKLVNKKQDESKGKKGIYISIPSAIKEIITEWGEMKGIKINE